MLMVAPERPAVDKLLAEKVILPNIQAAEDLYLRPVAASAAAIVSGSLLRAPHQPSDLIPIKLIVPPIWCRQPEASESAAVIVMLTHAGNRPVSSRSISDPEPSVPWRSLNQLE